MLLKVWNETKYLRRDITPTNLLTERGPAKLPIVHRKLGSVYSFVFVSIEKIYRTLEKVFHRLFEHREFRQKYSAARHIFNSLLGV